MYQMATATARGKRQSEASCFWFVTSATRNFAVCGICSSICGADNPHDPWSTVSSGHLRSVPRTTSFLHEIRAVSLHAMNTNYDATNGILTLLGLIDYCMAEKEFINRTETGLRFSTLRIELSKRLTVQVGSELHSHEWGQPRQGMTTQDM